MSELSWNLRGLYMLSSYHMVGSGWDNWFRRNGELKQQKQEDETFFFLSQFFCLQFLSGWNFLPWLASMDISKRNSSSTLHQQRGITKRFGKGTTQQNHANILQPYCTSQFYTHFYYHVAPTGTDAFQAHRRNYPHQSCLLNYRFNPWLQTGISITFSLEQNREWGKKCPFLQTSGWEGFE